MLAICCFATFFAACSGGGNAGKTVYTVKFVSDGKVISEQTVEDGKLPVNPFVAGKEGYDFIGWSGDYTDVTENRVLKMRYETSEKVTGLKLYKKPGEKLDVLVFSDIQIINILSDKTGALSEEDMIYTDPEECVLKCVRYLIESRNPDYIVLMGDNIYSRFELTDLRTHRMLYELIDGYGIPWSLVYGNHDGDTPDCTVTRSQIESLLKECDNCLYDNGGAEQGDYSISVLNEGSDELAAKFFFMYSHYNYGWYTKAQLSWYDKEAGALNGEKVIPSVLFTHIPMPEVNYAFDKYKDSFVTENDKFVSLGIPQNTDGDFGEVNNMAYHVESGLFKLIKKNRSTQLVVMGHEHANAATASFQGVRFAFGLKTGNYVQAVKFRERLDGGSELVFKKDFGGYEWRNVYYKDGSVTGAEFAFNDNPQAEKESAAVTTDGSLCNISGKTPVKLADGQSTSVTVDMSESLLYLENGANVQSGFFVSNKPINTYYPYTDKNSAEYLYFMSNGFHAVNGSSFEAAEDAIVSYLQEGNKVINHAEQIFARGNSVRFTLTNDNGAYTFEIKVKGVEEADTAYKNVERGTLINIDLSGGVYLAMTSNRNFSFYNLTIDGSEYMKGYTMIGCSVKIGDYAEQTVTPSDGAMSFISNKEAIKLNSASDMMYMEFTMRTPPSGVSSASIAGFAINDGTNRSYHYLSSTGNAFRLACHHVDLSVETGGSDTSITYNKHDTSLLNASDGWSGSVFLASNIRFRMEFYGDGTFKLYHKYADGESDFELAVTGKAEGFDFGNGFYIGFMSYSAYTVSDLDVNGVTDISKIRCLNGEITE